MIHYLDLYRKITPYRVTRDSDMPFAYQRANPKGRPLHDDWIALKSTPRMNTAYKVPFPFRKIAGNQAARWVPYQDGYPLSPDAQLTDMPYYDGQRTVVRPHIAVYEHIAAEGEWSVQAAYLGGAWVECFYTATTKVLGMKFQRCWGLKPDTTLGDFMAWFPEVVIND